MKAKSQIDLWLLLPVAILLIVSLIILLSLNFDFFKNQAVSLIVGLLAYAIVSRINIDFLKGLSIPIYVISIVLLLIILVIGIETRGAVRWVDIFGIRLQFSEILKPFLALAFASSISNIERMTKLAFLKLVLLTVPVFILIFLQPDLGSALLYVGIAFFALIVSGFPFRWFAFLFMPLVILSPFFWYIMHDYQRQRILTFLGSNSDPLGASYNGIQAIIAIGSGGFMGKGISEGTQSVLRFLPERHTDFIFATIAEGLGFLGAGLIIIAFTFLLFRIYVLFKESGDLFGKIFMSICFGAFLIPGFINIGMNMGILPIVGITLPFVSFGGSSLLSNFIFLGMISSLKSSRKDKHVLEIR